MQNNYIVCDPSAFISITRLIDTIKVLRTFHFHLHKVILPTDLYNILEYILRKREIKSITIFKRWSPFSSKEDIRKRILDERYIKILRYFFEYFNPQSADRHIRDIDKLGSESIFKKDVIKKLGQEIGHIIFDILALSNKFRALLISFGNITTNFIRRIGVPIFECPSKIKQRIKQHANIRKILKIMIYASSLDIIKQFIEDFGLINIKIVANISIVGILVIADG